MAFSQGELEERRDDFVAAVAGGALNAGFAADMYRADYVDRVAAGGYPEAIALPQRLREDWFDSYLSRLLERDLAQLSRISDPLRLRSLLTEPAATRGAETLVARLGNLANLPAATTSSYLDLLRALYLVERIPPWTPNLLKREVGRSKYILTDPGLATWLTRTSPAALKDIAVGQSLGGLLEAFVATELMRQQAWSEERFTVSHYRSPDGREIDQEQ